MPRPMASWAGPGHDRRRQRAPVSAGDWQDSALIWAASSAVNEGGRRDYCGRPALVCRPRRTAPPLPHGAHERSRQPTSRGPTSLPPTSDQAPPRRARGPKSTPPRKDFQNGSLSGWRGPSRSGAARGDGRARNGSWTRRAANVNPSRRSAAHLPTCFGATSGRCRSANGPTANRHGVLTTRVSTYKRPRPGTLPARPPSRQNSDKVFTPARSCRNPGSTNATAGSWRRGANSSAAGRGAQTLARQLAAKAVSRGSAGVLQELADDELMPVGARPAGYVGR